jgi:hypothetical protein
MRSATRSYKTRELEQPVTCVLKGRPKRDGATVASTVDKTSAREDVKIEPERVKVKNLLLGAVPRERLAKTQHAGKGLADAMDI